MGNKNSKAREGYFNRHIQPLPDQICIIEIITKDVAGEHISECIWTPYNKMVRHKFEQTPSEGYLGSAKVIKGDYPGIGHHAWEQNDYEFVYYKIKQNEQI